MAGTLDQDNRGVRSRYRPGTQLAPPVADEALLSPQQLATIQGLRQINAAMRGANAAPAADPLVAMQAKAAALKQDAGAIRGGGLPGYFDPQARTGVGMAPGPIQFNMPAPAAAPAVAGDPRAAMLQALQAAPNAGNAAALADRAQNLPASVDPMTNLRGSTQNNMRDRFRALAAANMPPSEAEQAVANRRPNLDLTFAQFKANRDARRSAANETIAANPESPEAAAAELALQRMGATGAGLDTAARRAGKALGIGPGEYLAQRAAAKGSPVATRGRAAANKGASETQPQGIDGGGANPLPANALAELERAHREGGADASAALLRLYQLQVQHALSMSEQKQRDRQLEISGAEVDPEKVAAIAKANQDPDSVALEKDLASGKLTAPVSRRLEEAAANSNIIPLAPDWMFNGSGLHRANLWKIAQKELPGISPAAFAEWYDSRFGNTEPRAQPPQRFAPGSAWPEGLGAGV